MKNFSQLKAEYDSKYKCATEIKAIVPVHLTFDKKCGIVKKVEYKMKNIINGR